MTTPIEDFVMPVSFTLVRQAGDDYLVRADGGDHYRLEGPSVVAASWSGPQKAEIWHHHNPGAGWKWRKLAEFNGGGEPRSESGQNPGRKSWCMSVLLRLRRMWPRTTEGRSRFIRSNVWGGGVNDDTTGNGLDAVRRAQAGVVGEQRKGHDSSRARPERHRRYILAPGRCASIADRFRRGPVDVALPQKPQAIRYGRPPQWANGARGDGRAGANRDVCVHGNPGYAAACGRDYLPNPRLTTTAVAGGGTLNDNPQYRVAGFLSGVLAFPSGSRIPIRPCPRVKARKEQRDTATHRGEHRASDLHRRVQRCHRREVHGWEETPTGSAAVRGGRGNTDRNSRCSCAYSGDELNVHVAECPCKRRGIADFRSENHDGATRPVAAVGVGA